MATPGKRSAEEAFEGVQQSGQSAEQKRKKRKKNKKDRADKAKTADALRSPHESHDVGEEGEQEISAHGRQSIDALAEPGPVSRGGKSKKKRNREWREKHAPPPTSSPTAPKKEVKEDTQHKESEHREESALPVPDVEEAESNKRKRRRQRKRKGEDAVDTVLAPAEHDDTLGHEALEDDLVRLQEQPTSIATIDTHPIESGKEVRKREKREQKRLRRQLQSRPEAAANEVVEVEDELMVDDVKPEEAAKEPNEECPELLTERGAEGQTSVDLQGRIGSPKKSSKRKKRYRPGRETHVIKRERPEAGEQEEDSAMQVDEDVLEVISAPLEDRIEIPDEIRNRQQVAEMDGDALSADDAGDEEVLDIEQHEKLVVTLPEKKRKPRRSVHGDANRSREQYDKVWSITEDTGGVFIDQEPILTPDDQHLILSTRSEIHIYSRLTSLLVRSLRPAEPGHIVSCTLSSSDPSHLLVATSAGVVSLWDWTDASLLDAWSTFGGLRQIIPVAKEGFLAVLAVHHNDKRYTLKVFQLGTGTDEAIEVTTLQSHKHLGAVQFFQNAGVLVTYAHRRIIIGYCRNLDLAELDEESFSWHKLRLPSTITSFDAQVGPSVGKRRLPRIDLAVGLATGSILTFEDILFKSIGEEKDPSTENVQPRTLSWHRNLVHAVKWTPDGNYIISGGRETTLVIWQLDTSTRETLPHLSSPILNLAVSNQGSAYALRFADNSVLVLGTANRTPETNISGLALSNTGRIVTSLHPSSPERLLVACPADTLPPLDGADHNTSLQTYDIRSNTQLRRQALTRNVTTVVNIDPEGRPLREPNVSHLRISADGRWLATIDEWEPPNHDLDATFLPEETAARKETSEIRLRIWSHNDDLGDWELVTRVDDPNSVARIISLQSNPVRAEFAAVGADGIIRTWQPRARVRDGVRVRDAQGKQLFTWMSIHAVNVPMDGKEVAKSAALAYSDDGSILAVSLELRKKGLQWIHFIDARSGEVMHSVPDLVTSGERHTAFAGRSLVSLSDMICVYDVVNAQVVWKTELAKEYVDSSSGKYLAVNRIDNTISIGLNGKKKHGGYLTVLDATRLEGAALLEERIAGQIRAVLAFPSISGFVVIDNYSQIRQIRPPGRSRALIPAAAARSEEVEQGLDRVFGKKQAVDGEGRGTGTALKLLTDGSEAVTGRTLEEAFSFDTSASAPGVDDLFERIAGVFARPAVLA